MLHVHFCVGVYLRLKMHAEYQREAADVNRGHSVTLKLFEWEATSNAHAFQLNNIFRIELPKAVHVSIVIVVDCWVIQHGSVLNKTIGTHYIVSRNVYCTLNLRTVGNEVYEEKERDS